MGSDGTLMGPGGADGLMPPCGTMWLPVALAAADGPCDSGTGAACSTVVMLASTMLSSRCFGDFALYPDYRTQVDTTLDGNW